jgi:hypothetical protein
MVGTSPYLVLAAGSRFGRPSRCTVRPCGLLRAVCPCVRGLQRRPVPSVVACRCAGHRSVGRLGAQSARGCCCRPRAVCPCCPARAVCGRRAVLLRTTSCRCCGRCGLSLRAAAPAPVRSAVSVRSPSARAAVGRARSVLAWLHVLCADVVLCCCGRRPAGAAVDVVLVLRSTSCGCCVLQIFTPRPTPRFFETNACPMH